MPITKDFFGNSRTPNPPPGSSQANNTYAAGAKRYGAGRSMPNIGNMSGGGMMGYAMRDQKAQARKNAIKRRLGGQDKGNPMNKNVINSGKGVF